MIGWILGAIALGALCGSDDHSSRPCIPGSYGNNTGNGNRRSSSREPNTITRDDLRRHGDWETGSYTPPGGFERF